MDAPTYVERLRGGFKRARDGAASLKQNLEHDLIIAERIKARLQLARDVATFVEAEVTKPALNKDFAALSDLTNKSSDFANHFLTFLQVSTQSLRTIENDICSDTNIAGAEGESVLVSRELERHALFRPLPILWALSVTILVKIVLAHNTAEALHSQAIPLLILSFLLTWALSIYIGISTRTRRMRSLQRHVQQQFRAALGAPVSKDVLVEFPPIGPSMSIGDPTPVKAFPYRRKIIRHKWRVACRNLWALVLPMLLLVIVLITRKDGEHHFIARFDSASPCILATGHLSLATKKSFFVTPIGTPNGPWESALSRVFPELLSDVIRRDAIVSIVDATTDFGPDMPLRDCNTPEPLVNSHKVELTGNALGQWGQQTTIDAMSNHANSIITAVSNNGPTISLPDTYLTLLESNEDTLTQRFNMMIDRQEQLIATLVSQPTADNVVVTPVLYAPAPHSTKVENTTNANIFQTSITTTSDGKTLDTLGNTLVLPFFTAPVRDGSGRLATPQAAFDWGRNTDNLEDPVVLADGKTYFARIAETLESCLADDAIVTIDVIGLASRSWDGPTPNFSDAQLNYHLAEGRRFGALQAIAGLISEGPARNRLFVQQFDGTTTPLAKIMRDIQESTQVAELLPRFGRFDGVAGFEARRDTLLAVTGLNPDVKSPLEELFGRSVVLRMISTDGGPCQF